MTAAVGLLTITGPPPGLPGGLVPPGGLPPGPGGGLPPPGGGGGGLTGGGGGGLTGGGGGGLTGEGGGGLTVGPPPQAAWLPLLSSQPPPLWRSLPLPLLPSW